MGKFRNVDRIWNLKKYPTAEVITHISFYILRLGTFIIIRAVNFHVKVVNKKTISGANSIILSIIFSLFLVFFVLYNIFTENIYGYCLAVVLMFHNFALTVAMVILAHLTVHSGIKYWYIGMAVAISYLLEMCCAIFFIHKKRIECNKSLFQKIGADQKINDIYSLRKRIETYSSINLFLPMVIIEKIYFTPDVFVLKFEYLVFLILILTGIQHIFIYTDFYGEDILQRKIAIAVTVIKAIASLVLLMFAAMNYGQLLNNGRDVRIILYVDLILITLAFLYYLRADMKNFGKGLKQHIMFRTRKLTL